jgi:hypothetical protein
MKLEIILACCVPVAIGLIVLVLAIKEKMDSKKKKTK